MRYGRINKGIKVGPLRTSKKELYDLVKAWLVISLVFVIAFRGLSFGQSFFMGLLVSMFTVGLGFIFHELMHKTMAQHYGCMAEFRANDSMLILAFFVSLLGVVFAAPGAVMIQGNLLKKENGIISSAGPLSNFVLAGLFLLLSFLYPAFAFIGMMGAQVNTWLGMFNLIPFGMFDGKKIFNWNKMVWGSLLVLGIVLFASVGLF